MNTTDLRQTDNVDSVFGKDRATTAMERSQLYGLLARVFREEPDTTCLEQLRNGDFFFLSKQAGLDFGDEFVNAPTDLLCEELAIEYSRLFLGPGKHISPHESVQLENGSGSLWGNETVLVKRFIEATGILYDSAFNGIPDHVSVELEFLSKLAGDEAKYWQMGDEKAARNSQDWQQDFLLRHASKWIPRFCQKVIDSAELSFYKVFARLLDEFIESEVAAIAR